MFMAFRAAGHAVTVCCHPGDRWTGSLRGAGVGKELTGAGIVVHHLVVRHRLDRRAIRWLRACVRTESPDIIYAPLNKTLSASLRAVRGTRVRVVGYRGTLGHISRWDPACWLTYLNPRVACILCVSDAVRRYLVSVGVRPERVVTVYKGHDPDWYAGTAPLDRHALGISDKEFMLAFTGNIRPVKGVDVLLAAVRRLPADVPLRLVLVGHVHDERIFAALQEPDLARRVVCTGYRRDALSIVAAADAYVLPSVGREGLPRGVVEAMCLRKPVIASGVGGLSELVEHGRSGLVVPPRDVAALAGAIQSLAADPARGRQLGQAAHERIRTDFHIRHTIAAVLELFGKLAGRLTKNGADGLNYKRGSMLTRCF